MGAYQTAGRKIEYRRVGGKIRKRRRELGMTQERLAELADISSMYMGQIERGERRTTLDHLADLAGLLDLSLDYLLCDQLISSAASQQCAAEWERLTKALSAEKKAALLKAIEVLVEEFQ